MSVDSFKMFVRKNPNLIKYVNNNEMTWQKFYEMYDLYGEDNSIWDKYVKEENIDIMHDTIYFIKDETWKVINIRSLGDE